MPHGNIRQSITKLVPLMERLSLLRINQDALDRVVKCVEFSNNIINELDDDKLKNIEPMISPTENQCVFMRNDSTETCQRDDIVRNASKMVEDYFVTPSKHKHYSDL